MKRIFCILAVIIMLLSSFQSKRFLLARDYYREEALLENIAQAIEMNNADGLLSVFSAQAKTDSAVMEDEIRQFMIDFSDEEITWEKTIMQSNMSNCITPECRSRVCIINQHAYTANKSLARHPVLG